MGTEGGVIFIKGNYFPTNFKWSHLDQVEASNEE